MIIQAPIQGVYSAQLHQKLFERLSALEREYPWYPKDYLAYLGNRKLISADMRFQK